MSASRTRAIGSAGERLVHTEEVTGSIPVSPTSLNTVPGPTDRCREGQSEGQDPQTGWSLVHLLAFLSRDRVPDEIGLWAQGVGVLAF
jgi:hypothetical protein